MELKIKESMSIFFVLAMIAFVAGAENYYSEVGSELKEYHQSDFHPASIAPRIKLKVRSKDSIRLSTQRNLSAGKEN